MPARDARVGAALPVRSAEWLHSEDRSAVSEADESRKMVFPSSRTGVLAVRDFRSQSRTWDMRHWQMNFSPGFVTCKLDIQEYCASTSYKIRSGNRLETQARFPNGRGRKAGRIIDRYRLKRTVKIIFVADAFRFFETPRRITERNPYYRKSRPLCSCSSRSDTRLNR